MTAARAELHAAACLSVSVVTWCDDVSTRPEAAIAAEGCSTLPLGLGCVAAESVVVTAVRATTRELSAAAPSYATMASWEPGLKPYQPSQRMKVPRTTSGAE